MAGAQLNGSTDAEEERPSTSLGTNGKEVTRRAVLGAALAVPLASLPAPLEAQDWKSALEDFHAAQAEVLRIEAATAGASMEEEEKHLPAHDAACAGMEDALARALAAPAPDLPALAAKLGLLFRHELEPHALDDDVAAAILADTRRLLRAT